MYHNMGYKASAPSLSETVLLPPFPPLFLGSLIFLCFYPITQTVAPAGFVTGRESGDATQSKRQINSGRLIIIPQQAGEHLHSLARTAGSIYADTILAGQVRRLND